MKIINTALIASPYPIPIQCASESAGSTGGDAGYLGLISHGKSQTEETAISQTCTPDPLALASQAQARNAELFFRGAEAQNSAYLESLNRAFAASTRVNDHRCQRLDDRVLDLARALDAHQQNLSEVSGRHASQAATLEEAISMMSLRVEALEVKVTGLERRCSEQYVEQISQQNSADRSLTEWLTKVSDRLDGQEERWQARWSNLRDDVERRLGCAEATASEADAALRRHREETNVWLDEIQLHLTLQSRFGRE